MTFRVERDDNIDETVFNRLWDDTRQKAIVEQERHGSDNLKTMALEGHRANNSIILYKDDYIVGYLHYILTPIFGETYMAIMLPTYGRDEAGSRAWFYSQEFVEAFASFVKSIDAKGVWGLINPASPFQYAVFTQLSTFHNDTKYFEDPIVHPDPSVIIPNLEQPSTKHLYQLMISTVL
jgi:hypothetical protein